MALQHYFIGFFRIWAIWLHIMSTIEFFIIIGRRALKRKNGLPPVHDTIIFREEAMSANIHTITVMANSARNTTEFSGRFKNSHLELFRPIVFEKFIGSSKTSRTASNNHNSFLCHRVKSLFNAMPNPTYLIRSFIQKSV